MAKNHLTSQYREEQWVRRTFGKLTVKQMKHLDKKRVAHWICDCDCGAEVVVQQYELKRGLVMCCPKCGLNKNQNAADFDFITIAPEIAKAWMTMHGRCYNEKHPEYKKYGGQIDYYTGKGVQMCVEWSNLKQRRGIASFYVWSFMYAGYKPGAVLRRKDKTKNYKPHNCEWAVSGEKTADEIAKALAEYGEPGIHRLPNGKFKLIMSINGWNIRIGVYDRRSDAVDAERKTLKGSC
jgi:hypothetical protein